LRFQLTPHARRPDGQIHDAAAFASSGGQNVVGEVLKQTEGHEKELVTRATSFLAELEALKEAAAERKQKLGDPEELEEADETKDAAAVEYLSLDDDEDEDDEEDILGFSLEVPTRDDVQAMIELKVEVCKDAVSVADSDGYTAAFQAMVDLLQDLRGCLRAGFKLENEHHQMAIQLDEAEDLVGLLCYDGDEKSACEAADIVRQVSIDFWSRVASETAEVDVELSDESDVDLDQSEIGEHQIAV